MTVLLGLLAALCYGVSDFAAGIASKRASVITVAAGVQVAAVAVLAVAVLASGAGPPGGRVWAGGAVAGLGSAVGSVALYRGLARGRMGLVAPISGVVAAAVPVGYALVRGEGVHRWHLAGVVLGVIAVALVSAGGEPPPGGATVASRVSVVDGAVAGVGFALFYLGLNGTDSASVWPAAVAYAVSTAVIALAWLAVGGRRLPDRRSAGLMVAGGATAAGAALLFERTAQQGSVAVASVLTSMYPAVTMLMAAVLLRERYRPVNVVGMAAAVAAIVLIALPG